MSRTPIDLVLDAMARVDGLEHADNITCGAIPHPEFEGCTIPVCRPYRELPGREAEARRFLDVARALISAADQGGAEFRPFQRERP